MIDQRRLLFSVRTSIASVLALGVGLALGLESPHWAAITVWVVTQPSRGMTLSKAFYRFLGTCAGAFFAILLIHFFAGDRLMFLCILSLWIGFTAGGANLVQYFRSYGFMLAGFTAALVSLSVFSHPDQVLQVAEARVSSIFLGVAVALAMTVFLRQGNAKVLLSQSLDALLAQSFIWTGNVFRRLPREKLIEGGQELITQISQVEELITYSALESMQVRRQKKNLHSFLATCFRAISSTRALGLHFREYPELVKATQPQRQEWAVAHDEFSQSILKKMVRLLFSKIFENCSNHH